MKSFSPYLNFDGQTRDAMTFYQSCLGGQLDVMPASSANVRVPAGSEDRTIHARLVSGPITILASDTMHGTPCDRGENSSHLCIHCSDTREQDRLWAALGAGGKVTMPLQDTFWGARFGMLTDKFGVSWMFNADHAKS